MIRISRKQRYRETTDERRSERVAVVTERDCWTGPPEEPIPYPNKRLRADRRAGRRDGRRSLVRAQIERFMELREANPDAAPPAFQTAYLTQLAHEAADIMHAEYLSCHEECRELAVRAHQAECSVRRLRLCREVTERAFATAQSRAAAGPETHDLARRGASEANPLTHPDGLIARRRVRALANAVDKAAGDHIDVEARLEEQTRNAALLNELIRRREGVAKIRARRVYEHYRVRRAIYLEQLVRKHAGQSLLNSLLDLSAPELPEWVPDDEELLA